MLAPQLVESTAAVTWAFFAMPAKDLDAAVPIVDVRAPPDRPAEPMHSMRDQCCVVCDTC